MEQIQLEWVDLAIMIVYLVGMVWYGLRHAKQSSSEDYFLAGRDMTWPIVGISLFAANISSSTLIGLTSDAYKTNLAVYNYEWMAAVVLIFFAIFFLPFYLKSRVYTMPEFLERRYDTRSRYYFSFVTLIGNVLVDTAAGLYAGILILKIMMPGLPSYVIVIILAAAAAAYTIPGGLSSVVHTEVIQAILLIIGSILITYFAFNEVGGWGGMMEGLEALRQADPTKVPKEPSDVFSIVRPADDDYMAWPALVTTVPLLGFYFWATNQFMVQRALSAKSLNHGRWGALFAGALKLPVIFIMVVPGVAALVMFHDLDISSLNYYTEIDGVQTPCTNLSECPNLTYPILLFKLLPTGIMGLVLASLLAAMSSSISATLNSASTLITMDFVSKINPNLSSKQLVRSGKIATLVLVVLAAAWAPQIEKFGSLFEYLQLVITYTSPPVVSVFLTGLFIKRVNSSGAIVSLVLGFLIGLFMMMSAVFDLLPAFNEIHFLYKGLALFIVCLVVHLLVSFVTRPQPDEQIKDYIWTPKIFKQETEELKGLPWYQNFRILGIILLILTAIIVGWFW